MEEQKKTKTVKMNANNQDNGTQKLTYEQLNEACSQLYQQNQQLVKQLQEAAMANMFKRLDYLFLVLNYANVIKDDEFIGKCIDEIKDALTITPEESERK